MCSGLASFGRGPVGRFRNDVTFKAFLGMAMRTRKTTPAADTYKGIGAVMAGLHHQAQTYMQACGEPCTGRAVMIILDM